MTALSLIVLIAHWVTLYVGVTVSLAWVSQLATVVSPHGLSCTRNSLLLAGVGVVVLLWSLGWRP